MTVNQSLPDRIIAKLREPTGGTLEHTEGRFRGTESDILYRIDDSGIPILLSETLGDAATSQQTAYDTKAAQYAENLTYPHTIAYTRYLDGCVRRAMGKRLGETIEICCGTGLFWSVIADDPGFDVTMPIVGVDISLGMLRLGLQTQGERYVFIQGDATKLPFADASFDTVVMLGGVHHVPDRSSLFQEIARIMRDDGSFIWREPCNDFILWRWIRGVIYRFSPMLDPTNEQPLERRATEEIMAQSGLRVVEWKTVGLFGFALFMNSHVLKVNKIFKYVKSIDKIIRVFSRIDETIIGLPFCGNMGMIVVGSSRKVR